MSLSIKNAILQLFSAELQYTGSAKDKPAFMNKNTKFSVNAGTVTIDSSEQKTEGNKIALLLDAVLMPSKLKKTIRESFTGKLSDVVKFNMTPTHSVPSELLKQIHHIQAQTDKFRVK